jgi:hypothetical protein
MKNDFSYCTLVSQVLSNPFKFTKFPRWTRLARRLQEHIDLKELAGRLGRVFPNLVTLSDDMNTITVMGRVMVTSEGLAERSGPVADRVKVIFEEYVRDQSRERVHEAPSPKDAKMRNPFRCQHCGLQLTSGRVYRRSIGGTVMLFCCKQCADHEEAKIVQSSAK